MKTTAQDIKNKIAKMIEDLDSLCGDYQFADAAEKEEFDYHREDVVVSLDALDDIFEQTDAAQLENKLCRCRQCLTERGAVKAVSLTGSDLTTFGMGGEFVGMIVCEICGNKRCPHATDHNFECTNSNSTGQAGSIYD